MTLRYSCRKNRMSLVLRKTPHDISVGLFSSGEIVTKELSRDITKSFETLYKLLLGQLGLGYSEKISAEIVIFREFILAIDTLVYEIDILS